MLNWREDITKIFCGEIRFENDFRGEIKSLKKTKLIFLVIFYRERRNSRFLEIVFCFVLGIFSNLKFIFFPFKNSNILKALKETIVLIAFMLFLNFRALFLSNYLGTYSRTKPKLLGPHNCPKNSFFVFEFKIFLWREIQMQRRRY